MYSPRQMRLAFLAQPWSAKMDFKESLMVEVRSQESVLNVSAVSFSTVVKLLNAYTQLLFSSHMQLFAARICAILHITLDGSL